jgi:flagellar protein FlbD
MIRLTRLNGEIFFVNYFQILYLESIPETKVRLANGDYYLVRDTVESILLQVQEMMHRYISGISTDTGMTGD